MLRMYKKSGNKQSSGLATVVSLSLHFRLRAATAFKPSMALLDPAAAIKLSGSGLVWSYF